MEKTVSIKSNFIFNALYQVTSIIVPVITLPYLSRILHAEGLGVYSFAFSVSSYFYLFIRLGLYSYGNRTIAFTRDDKLEMSKSCFAIYAFQIFVAIVVSLLYAVYMTILAPDKMLARIFFLVVLTGGIDLTWVLYGLEEFKATAIRDILVKVITTACILHFVRTAEHVWVYALIYSVGFFASQLVVTPLVAKRVTYVRPSIQDICQHIKPNLVLFLPTIAVSIYRVMDNIMLGTMANTTELGYYHNCDSLIKIPMALITALGTIMLPRMTNMIANDADKKELESVFDKSIIFAMFLSTSICFGIMTVAIEFVPIFFGGGFEKCVPLSYIILPCCVFVAFANVIRTQILLPRKLDKQFVISLFAGAGVNLLLNILLIPRSASIGAAIGTLVAEIVVCVVQAACVFKEADIGRNIINSLPFVFAGIVMFVTFHNYNVPIPDAFVALLVKIIISGLLYMAVLGAIVGVKRLLVRKAA